MPIGTNVPNLITIGQTVAEISRLTFFTMAAVRHFGFSSLIFLNSVHGPEGQYASACKISSKLVKQLLRYNKLAFSRRRPSAVLDLWGKL